MNKNKLFIIIASVSLFIIFLSLIAIMVLTPSVKEKTSNLYKKEIQSLETSLDKNPE